MALGNCAKMNLSMQDARDLTWWEYQALVAMHQGDDDQVDAPDPDIIARGFERLELSGHIGSMH